MINGNTERHLEEQSEKWSKVCLKILTVANCIFGIGLSIAGIIILSYITALFYFAHNWVPFMLMLLPDIMILSLVSWTIIDLSKLLMLEFKYPDE